MLQNLFDFSLYSYLAFALVFLALCAISVALWVLYGANRKSLHRDDFALRVAENHSHPIWVINQSGHILWQNNACPHNISSTLDHPSKNDPPRLNFAQNNTPHWYDVTETDLGGGNRAFFAAPANEKLQAVAAKNEFMQTLSKIFAQLSTGLAVFDQNRDLILFNPSLLDLTQLSFESLSRKPSLPTFLDLLRERGLVPEPRNYAQWRDDIAKMEIAAKIGKLQAISLCASQAARTQMARSPL